jgi:hypothetical protein
VEFRHFAHKSKAIARFKALVINYTDLYANNMTNAGAFAIAEFISSNKTITSLSISMTEILATMSLPKTAWQK